MNAPTPSPTTLPAGQCGRWSRWMRGWRAWWMMRKGWRCEGPFPPVDSRSLIVLSPGFTEESPAFHLLDHRLRYQARWHSHHAGQKSDGNHANGWEGIVLLEASSEELSPLLAAAAHQEISVQLVTLVPHLKRIRCNTPFVPGRQTERTRAYIDRLFSYWR